MFRATASTPHEALCVPAWRWSFASEFSPSDEVSLGYKMPRSAKQDANAVAGAVRTALYDCPSSRFPEFIPETDDDSTKDDERRECSSPLNPDRTGLRQRRSLLPPLDCSTTADDEMPDYGFSRNPLKFLLGGAVGLALVSIRDLSAAGVSSMMLSATAVLAAATALFTA